MYRLISATQVVAALLAIFAVCSPVVAEPLIVDVWPGKTPGDAGIAGQESTRTYESAIIAGPTKLITNVTRPTLTVYRPAKEKNAGTAMIICPGGGYHDLFWELEGEEVAAWLNSLGMTGIILKYRVPRRPADVKGEPPLGPQLDAQRAVSLVRSRAAEWGIDPKRIGMIGFSAGGHLALATATGFEKRTYEPIDVVDEVSCRPDFAVLCYSGYLKAKEKDATSAGIHVPAGTPPILLAHSSDDTISDAEHSVFMYLALKRAGVPAELHVFASGNHDFGVRQNEKLPSAWTQLCVRWLASLGLLSTNASLTSKAGAPTATVSKPADASPAAAQPADDIRELKLKQWAPKPMLVVKQTSVERPKSPAIDVHNHLGAGKQFLTPDRVGRYLQEMNEAGVATVVNLDGGWGEQLKETLSVLDEAHPGRFLTFAQINFDGIDDDGWTERETAQLEKSFQAGAKGLKFHKSLGLGYRYKDGRLMPADDPKLAPIFETCERFRRPVMIHTGDPAAFFTPLDRFNERWHELNEHPNWLFFGDRFPPREELLKQFANVVAAHPNTTFIGAHFGNNAEDLATVGRWLDAYPNLYVDIDARISELGRQPYTARRFLIKYRDRVLFGTDTTPRREAYRTYYRFLETDDEYFDCAASHHLQGFWMIYGISLPDEVLESVYRTNAERVLLRVPKTAASGDDPAKAVESRR
ncbi:MAG TPA: amidohydrolase family protein [Pirellulales bacterium]|jgi:acetyl esterase/lipase/predicted TIM-barrel fold metal-dependent hydrolase|nr:amidohydrolase family protein [Pirellulales bacterium]